MEKAFKKILLAYDNRQSSRVALQKACDFATKFGSEVIALFVSDGKSEDLKNSRKFLEDFTSSKGILCTIIEKKGKMYDEVLLLEKKAEFSLVVMAAEDSSSWVPTWIGSSGTSKVIKSSNCPVITVKESAKNLGISNILLPLSDSNNTRQKVPYCSELAKAFGSTIHILGISKGSNQETQKTINSYVRQTERYFLERGLKFTVSIEFNAKVTERCISYGEEVDAGIMLIMTENEGAGILMDSYSQQLIDNSSVPIMNIHGKDTRLAGASGY